MLPCHAEECDYNMDKCKKFIYWLLDGFPYVDFHSVFIFKDKPTKLGSLKTAPNKGTKTELKKKKKITGTLVEEEEEVELVGHRLRECFTE